ncbi:RNA polymerase sigma factor [uncultured Caudovirales phage]|uniref:RNA polymerase sigma-like factor n=1 Tax=uncultured Caudovirales phage TaxID=2100421 RepID=A0A6J5M5Z8_9CAUD|nr:RNA polymerase sigma factor [uncultured Caudovirales phage]
MTRKPKRHYVNNKDFYDAIVVYKNKLKEDPNTRVPNYIGECILAICNKLSTKPNFIGYSFRDEMIADGVENCIVSVDGFNPEKSNNPFAYFTQIAWNAFIRRISKEKKQQYIKHKNMINGMILAELDDETFATIAGTKSASHEITNNIIDDFEKKLTKVKRTGIVGIEKFVLEQENEDESTTPSTTSSD